MSPVREILDVEEEIDFPVTAYLGRNTFGQHSTLAPGEFRDIINYDIYTATDGKDYLKSRRGSAFLRPAVPIVWPGTNIYSETPWDIGAEEYVIAQVDDRFYFQALLTPGNPTIINDFAGGTFQLGSTAAADVFVSGDRLFVIHPAGNKIIEWNGSTFRGRALGMAYPVISGISLQAGSVTGRYVYAIEKVYRVSGADVLVSTPNRKNTSRVFASATLSAQAAILAIQAAELDSDTLWTHLRLWKTKNLNTDLTDPVNPVDAQGTEDELYEVALITRAEMNAAALAAIATGSTLPEGNVGVTAGKPAGVYTVTDNNTDARLFNLIGLARIELIPLPASEVGCFHAKRIWVSGPTSNQILYSNAEGTKYSELYNPLNVVETGNDGLKLVRLFAMERDLVGLKESKTGRLVGGDPEQTWEAIDHRIGILQRRHAEYLPGIGIVAITNVDTDIRIFGLNYIWSTELNGTDIARPIHNDVAVLTAANVRFFYINGKVMLSEGNGTFHALQAHSRKGWTRYSLPMNTGKILNVFTFAGGTRAAALCSGSYTVEIEKSALDTDDSMVSGLTAQAMSLSYSTHRFQDQEGGRLLEQAYYEVKGKLSAEMRAIPFVNGQPWPARLSETTTAFTPSPFTYPTGEMQDRAYRLYLQPAAVGSFLWNRMIGNFLHYRIETTAPAVIRSQKLRAIADEAEDSFEAVDPFQQSFGSFPAPVWGIPSIVHLSFDQVSGDIAYDLSGNERHFSWTPGSPAGSHAYDATLAPDGGQSVVAGTGSMYQDADWTALNYIGDQAGLNSDSLTYEYVESFPSLAAAQVLMEGGNGTDYWRLQVNTDGSLEYQISTSVLAYKYTSAAGVIAAGSTQYTIQFILSDSGQAGQFYAASRSGTFTALTTTRSAL